MEAQDPLAKGMPGQHVPCVIDLPAVGERHWGLSERPSVGGGVGKSTKHEGDPFLGSKIRTAD